MSRARLPHRNMYTPLLFGDIPVDAIRFTLGIELDAGEVTMSANAQRHAARRHPNDYGRCLPCVSSVIASPLYLGDDFRNGGAVEFVGRPLRLGHPLLIAVEINIDSAGHYNL